jgi:hypothetical protein
MAASILASKQTPQEFTLSINTEFKSLIPPLSSEEYAQLEKNIIADGCRDPLVVFNNTLVDGHNRYEICVKHDLPFIFLEKDFSSKDAAKLWMIDNQKGRRNLTDGWKFQLSQNKKDILLGMGRAKQKEKNAWIINARSKIPVLKKEACYVCGKFLSISEAHHIYPLSNQYDDGVDISINDYVFLCPNHHTLQHIMINKRLPMDDDNLDDYVLEHILKMEQVERMRLKLITNHRSLL